uniref:Uncharacterized protein n=1 Tax=Fagus sylvatica TaxID=28930 RepID=A0A2N9G915_FAGSY
MAGKNAKKATSTSSKIPPNKLPEIKPELVTPSQLVRNHAVKWWDNFNRDRIIKFVYDEFPETKQVEDQPSSSIPDLLKGKSPEELAEICKYAAQACQAASASASGKGKSPASSEGSTTEMD